MTKADRATPEVTARSDSVTRDGGVNRVPRVRGGA